METPWEQTSETVERAVGVQGRVLRPWRCVLIGHDYDPSAYEYGVEDCRRCGQQAYTYADEELPVGLWHRQRHRIAHLKFRLRQIGWTWRGRYNHVMWRLTGRDDYLPF